jgi:thioredoxin-related protein
MFRCCLIVKVILLASAVPCLAQEPAPASIKWRTDYNAARKEAMEKKLPIVIVFADTSPYTHIMDKQLLKDNEAIRLLNTKFVPLRFETHYKENEPFNHLASALGIDAFPTMVFATHGGKILEPRLVGCREDWALKDRFNSILAELSPPDWRTSKFSRSSCWPR